MHSYVGAVVTLPPDPATAMGLVQHAVEWDEFSPSAYAVPLAGAWTCALVGRNLMSPLRNTALPTASSHPPPWDRGNSCLIIAALILTAQISLAAF